MCTLLTIDAKFWKNNRKSSIALIKSDARMNSDGVTAVLLGVNKSKDCSLSGMNIDTILRTIELWMDAANPDDRLFLHQRMATTQYVGLAFNHGFTDFLGGIIMHNGILRSTRANRLAVDSFALTGTTRGADDAVLALMEENESYANVFRIYPNEHRYEMLRLVSGSLYTDGFGNYSSNMLGGICVAVKSYTSAEHVLQARKTKAEKPKHIPYSGIGSYNYNKPYSGRENARAYGWDKYRTDHWDSDGYYIGDRDTYGVGGAYEDEADSAWKTGSVEGNKPKHNTTGVAKTNVAKLNEMGWFRSESGVWTNPSRNLPATTPVKDVQAVVSEVVTSAEERWAFEESDELLCENEYFFVIYNALDTYISVFHLSTGVLFEREYASSSIMNEIRWQGKIMLDESSVVKSYAEG